MYINSFLAPEVARGEIYNESCDVFSFGIIMFELLTETTTPYEKSSQHFSIEQRVANNPTFRPQLPATFVVSPQKMPVVKLMQQCWTHYPNERPSFESIVKELQQ